MLKQKKIAVIIPAYKVRNKIKSVITTLPNFIDHIFVIDDACPDHSGQIAKQLNRPNVTIIFLEKNKGVGAAVIEGYKQAAKDYDILVKMDGDGQMDPAYLDKLITPLLDGNIDYTKGNRFHDFKMLKAMPKIRLMGNSILSFLVKISSGYWNIMDPTNGYTAIKKDALDLINLDGICSRYFFESNLLIELNIVNIVVLDVAIPARYEDEESSLILSKVILDFPPKLVRKCCKRIFLKYFIYDFNMASVYLLLGIPMFLYGAVSGVYEWIDSISTGIPRSAGTIMLVALPLILSSQMLLHAIQIDIQNTPKPNN